MLSFPHPPIDLGLHGKAPDQVRGWLVSRHYCCTLQRLNPTQVKKKPDERDDVLEGVGGESLTSMQEAYDEAIRQFTHWRRDKLDFYRWRYAKHLLERALPGVRERLKQPRWFRHSWQDEYPDQKPPKNLDGARESLWFPERFINETYEAAWGDGETVLTVVAARFGWTRGQAYQATEDWFRDPVNYN
ncbi:hypothetical protein HOU03_gp345 [Caulobacter phage CcrSC]|uniref:Uncharacterized protein n=1 Tax=Caulobacter phage CcrSC TaxID=2283272 RepID=A0A385EDS7_9CAUD|nr:hypothetical protein HOU03_gp345 [Caulobacter phage CcrSC]AXQ69923.1 hypothetical protein CcrSC_gp341 [Caulobacter phage CcrSC]